MENYWNVWNMEILKKKQKISTISNWITRTYVGWKKTNVMKKEILS